jgi:NitT/TauT family transport system ATP-binding protein
LAERLQLEVDDLLPMVNAAVLLRAAQVYRGDIYLIALGQGFSTTSILRSKDLFRQQVLSHVPVLGSLAQTLREKRDGSMRADFFLYL